MSEESDKLYFVRRRGMRYEPEREEGGRKVRKVVKPKKSPKGKKMKREIFKYKQRGLSKVGEERKAVQERRAEPMTDISQLELEEYLKRKAGKQYYSEPKKRKSEKESEKRKEAEAEPEAEKEPEEDYGEEPPAYEPEEEPFEVLFPKTKKVVSHLKQLGLKAKQHRTMIRELSEMRSDKLHDIADKYSHVPGADEDVYRNLKRIATRKELRGRGLSAGGLKGSKEEQDKKPEKPKKPKKDKKAPYVREGHYMPWKELKDKPDTAGALDVKGRGFFGDLIKKAVKHVSKDPVGFAKQAFELGKKGHEMYKDKKASDEEDRKRRVAENQEKLWKDAGHEKAGSLERRKAGRPKGSKNKAKGGALPPPEEAPLPPQNMSHGDVSDVIQNHYQHENNPWFVPLWHAVIAHNEIFHFQNPNEVLQYANQWLQQHHANANNQHAGALMKGKNKRTRGGALISPQGLAKIKTAWNVLPTANKKSMLSALKVSASKVLGPKVMKTVNTVANAWDAQTSTTKLIVENLAEKELAKLNSWLGSPATVSTAPITTPVGGALRKRMHKK